MNIYKFKIYGHEYETKVVRREEDEVVISVNGQEYKAYLEPTKRQKMVRATPKVERPKVHVQEGIKTAAPDAPKGAGTIKAPLPGMVVKVVTPVGTAVKAGDPVMIMEAMKMENSVAATIDGTVSNVAVKEGDAVLEGQELITISAD